MASTVYVYPVVDPAVLVGIETKLAKQLFGLDQLDDGVRRFSVSPVTGGLRYVDRSAVWSSSPPEASTLPASVSAAEKSARAAIASWNAAAQPLLQSGPLLPTEVTLAGAKACLRRDGTPDHWLCRFTIDAATGSAAATPIITPSSTLAAPIAPAQPIATATIGAPTTPTTTSPTVPARAPVRGAWIDVRLGAYSRVVALSSNWRIPSGPMLVPLLTPPFDNATLFYDAGADSEPLAFLAPYYFAFDDDGDTGSRAAASEYSLTFEIAQVRSSDEVELMIIPDAHVGDLELRWFGWRVDDDDESGVLDLGTADTAKVGPGAYNIVVDARDSSTGAFARRQTLVYFGASG